MKAICEGKLYDSEKSECIGKKSFLGSDGWTSYNGLYRTTKGNFFLMGSRDEDCWDIEAVSIRDAKIWAEIRLTAEEYLKAFPEIEEA